MVVVVVVFFFSVFLHIQQLLSVAGCLRSHAQLPVYKRPVFSESAVPIHTEAQQAVVRPRRSRGLCEGPEHGGPFPEREQALTPSDNTELKLVSERGWQFLTSLRAGPPPKMNKASRCLGKVPKTDFSTTEEEKRCLYRYVRIFLPGLRGDQAISTIF